MHPFLELFSRRPVYFDGAMGTRLQAMGLKGGESPGLWNLSHPDDVKAVYISYLNAGADVVTANTFGINPLHFPEDWKTPFTAGIRLAREAVAETGRTAYVAMDSGSIGKLIEPLGDLRFEDAVTLYREAALAGMEAGCDFLLAETMTDLCEVKAAVLGYREALAEAGKEMPVLVSMSFDVNGRLLTGADIEGAAALLTSMEGVDALGLNCGREPAALLPNLKRLLACADGRPVFFMPNASIPTLVNGQTVFATEPEAFAKDMAEARRLGACGLGGCCGTTEKHIAAMVEATQRLAVAEKPAAAETNGLAPTRVSGKSGTVTLGPRPIIIGERLNPTGKKRMKQALKAGETGYLLSEATAQLEAGAHTLDVNVGMPELDEPAVLTQVVKAVQGVTGAPLQLDTADPRALETALRVYVGKPMINSVSGKQAVMDAVFPLVRKYGGALVCLLLDEDGIPATAEGRIAIARRILAEARRRGVPEKDLLFDALTMTVATDPSAARVTLETVRRLTEELKVKTVLGVSNVGFGLPGRSVITSAFLSMAIERGLSAAIINPLDTTVKQAFDGACATLGYDDGFAHYLAACQDAKTAAPGSGNGAETAAAREAVRLAGEAVRKAEAALGIPVATGVESMAAPAAKTESAPQTAPPEGGTSPLFQAVVRGLTTAAQDAANQLMDSGLEPLKIVETSVIPALTEVGARYERGEFFLPQLMQSATAAKQAIAAATARMPESKPSPARTVLLATVYGDVHDIGKNIVATLLTSYGFGVKDLGRNVLPEDILAAAKETGARLVGLSALMTTTVPAMKETIVLLRKNLPDVKIMVGGAVLTPELARDLGADGYSADAMGAVRYAGEVLR